MNTESKSGPADRSQPEVTLVMPENALRKRLSKILQAAGIRVSPRREQTENLREVLELHFEPPSPAAAPRVRILEVEVGAA